MKVGIFGGTFDPVHIGHLITIQSVIELRRLDKVILIPSYISPLKQEEKHSSPTDRMNMTKLAIEGNEKIEVSDFEIRKGNVSYTIDTVTHFLNEYSSIDLIIGYDNLLVFDKWKDPDKLVKLCNIVVMKRKSDIPDKKNKYFDSVTLIDTPVIEISSTEIRKRIRNNLPVNYLVPDPVLKYICKNDLYI